MAVIVIAFIAIILGGISCVRLEQKEQKTDAYHRMNLYAAEGNDHALRQMLAQKLVDVNHIEKGKPGLLENAVRGGHLSTVELLLDAGVKPEIKGVYSIPIAMAIERADVPMVKVLLAHGAHPKNCYIVKADDTQNKELIKILLAAGAEP
ncbi:MAG TPA: hypothetical protein VHV83_01730, partial [Armatimonadota bacterium]|nr:hypothetical protein [Armatimonadota bacterium]